MQLKEILKEIIDQDIRDHGIDLLVEKIEEIKPKNVLSKEQRMTKLFEKYKNCKACELCRERKNIVFGEGSLDSKLMFIGESPWEEEDAVGRPFLGEKGELLTKIIEAMNLKRTDVYITDLVKCYPLEIRENIRRTPTKKEIDICMKILNQQIDIIKPRVICTLGNTATKALLNILNKEKEITQIRGEEFDYRGFLLIPTFHPAFLLRQPSAKKLVWEDMKKIQRLL